VSNGRKIMMIEIKCQECGEKLTVTSKKAKNNNVGDFERLIITIEPCKCTKTEKE
jgi:hypothetical protein